MTPIISMAVVTNGPVAMAASKPNLFRIRGMMVPRVADMAMMKKIDSPTTAPSMVGSRCRKKETSPRKIP